MQRIPLNTGAPMLRKLSVFLWVLVVTIPAGRLVSDENAPKSYQGKVGEGDLFGSGGKDFSHEDLYTGDVSFSIPITTIGGLGVTLQYNSNVHTQVRADNNVLQSGWVGLGWTLNLGSIIADENNTKDITDDKYFLMNESGRHELIVESAASNSFKLKDYRYWKISRHLQNGYPIGLTVIRYDGTKYRH